MHIEVVLLPGFPAIDHALIEAMVRAANDCAGRALFTRSTASVGGSPVRSDDGAAVSPDSAVGAGYDAPDMLILCAGPQPAGYLPMALRGALRNAAQRGTTLSAGGHAVHVLSSLGYLDGHRATLPALPEPIGPMPPPRPIRNDPGPFVHDGLRITGRGSLATAPMLLSWIAEASGPALAAATAEALGMDAPGPQQGDTGTKEPKKDPTIQRMQAIMSTNLAAPLSLGAISTMLGISAEQLRGRCQKCLGAAPAKVYLALRLAHARDLVEGTALPVADIAAAAGFESASSFTRAFREMFDLSPRDVRRGTGAPVGGDTGTWVLGGDAKADAAVA